MRIALSVVLTLVTFHLGNSQSIPFSGDTLPPVSLTDINGKTIRTDSISGPVLIEVWASWCGPCRQRNVELNRLLKDLDTANLRVEDLTIIGVSLDTNRNVWKKAIRNDRIQWDFQLIDTARFDGVVARDWGIRYLPYNFLMDDGRIFSQSVYGEELRTRLQVLLMK